MKPMFRQPRFQLLENLIGRHRIYSFYVIRPVCWPGLRKAMRTAYMRNRRAHFYRIGLPYAGRWREILNTDASDYGGSGTGNRGAVAAAPHPWHGFPASAEITVPPLATLYLEFDPN